MKQATKLDAWRVAQGYTQLQLARELGISWDLIHRLCVGSRTPTLNVQVRFIDRFGREEAAKVFEASPVLAVMETVEAQPQTAVVTA